MSHPLYAVIRQNQVMIPMRDGVELAADVYLPGRDGEPLDTPVPVILERTPYDRTQARFAQEFSFFTRRGYAAVIQDVRGRYESGGLHDPFGHADVADGYDTCTWLAQQTWCNGRVGTVGGSYSATNQASLAMSGPPQLASQFFRQGFSNHYGGRLRQGGALRLSMVSWIFTQARQSHAALRDPALRKYLEDADRDVQAWVSRLPFRRGQTPFGRLPDYEDYLMNITTRGELDHWWLEPGRSVDSSWHLYPDVPVMLTSGWYDSHSHAVSWAYQELSKRMRSPVRLLMGPWVHGPRSAEQCQSGEAYFGPDAALEWDQLRLAWFEETIVCRKTGWLGDAPVRLFVMGGGSGRQVRSGVGVAIDVGGHWRDEGEWPLARAVATPLYLGPDGQLGPEPPETSAAGSTSLRSNPLDPVPTVGGPISSQGGLRMLPGAFDQVARPSLGHKDALPLASRPDVLVFESAPLVNGCEVTGPVEAVLYVSSNRPDTDFAVKLVDVYPPNEDFPDAVALNVSDGIMRVRYRRSWTEPSLLADGEVVELRVELPPTSLYFAPGHRIRVDVSSSNWPRFELNPNTGEPIGCHRCIEVATNTVHHSQQYASRIILPVVS